MRKKCFKCNKIKDINDFYLHKMMADGHLNKCKLCIKEYHAQRNKDPEIRRKMIEYESKRFNTPERKRKVLLYVQKRRASRPGRYKCELEVKKALRDGRLVKEPCKVCSILKVEGHHPDYRSPLKVIWLCRKHHLEIHGKVSNI